jgi:hypothetical protein
MFHNSSSGCDLVVFVLGIITQRHDWRGSDVWLITASCVRCHGGVNPALGVSLLVNDLNDPAACGSPALPWIDGRLASPW